MEKMREEFEKINPIPSGVTRCGDSYAATDWGWHSQNYVKAFDAFVSGWQASRAAQCVELPDSERSVDCGDVLYRSDVEQALDAAGIRYT